jgi:glycosyltransferase involved in cell wall biosynthesis
MELTCANTSAWLVAINVAIKTPPGVWMTIKVLMVGADDCPGGVTQYVNLLASYCQPKQFEFHATTSRATRPGKTFLHEVITKHLLLNTYSLWSFPLRVRQLRRILRKEKIRLLHLHTARAGLLGCIACFGLPIARIYTGHGWRFEQKNLKIQKMWFLYLESFICHAATAVTFLSQRDKDLGVAKGIVRIQDSFTINTRISTPQAEECSMIYPEISRTAFKIPGDAKVIGNAGYLSERKDPITFLLAGKRISAFIPGAVFLWVGDGELKESVLQLARQMNLESQLIITGFRPARHVPAFLYLMDVFLFTSKYEGVPLAVIEAQLCRRPVVCATYPGSSLLIQDGLTGYAFEPGNDQQAANMVMKTLSDVEGTNSIVKKAFALAIENHSGPGHMARQYEEVYRKAVQIYPPPK